MPAELLIPFLIGLIALLYSSVGHAGASGYIAVLALCGVATELLKPTALSLNLVVATVATIIFARAGWLRWRLLAPFLIASIPAAFLGGMLHLPVAAYKLAMALALAYAAWRLWQARQTAVADETVRPPSWPVALAIGAAIGLTSGLIGVGGGIFLSPLLMLMGWSGPRTTAAASAAFILANSAAGLAGHGLAAGGLPAEAPLWAACALAGGLAGSWLGAVRLPALLLRRLLAGALATAALKLGMG
jgi:uncharacterized membrane protein YfcA